MIARTARDPVRLLQPMQRSVREVDAALPVVAAMTMAQRVDQSLGVPRTFAEFLGGLGLLGLGLASLGLYAVVSFAVSRRSLEIGIRMALGARGPRVMWDLSRKVAKLLGVGVVVGLALSWVGILGLRVLSERLSEAPNLEWSGPSADVLTFALVATVMAAVGLTATFLPARRAARADPLVALRHL